LLTLRERAVQHAVLPRISLLDMERDKPQDGLTSALVAALRLRMERGEQSLLFLNRRGYAPVICCEACGWISNCHRCTAYMVLHRPEHRLRCHHCSLEMRIPVTAPIAAMSICSRWDAAPSGWKRLAATVP
jgi:primosomal protein N' (replication factor Y)